MFLKSVPPAVAIHSDWRSVGSVNGVGGGAPQSLGLPLCFNDSDSSLSGSGTPIRHKVQMIIETLRTTQSSDDGFQTEGSTSGSAHSSREALRQTGHALKTRPSSSRGGAVMEYRPPPPLHVHANPESQESDSDSDSSVDRGIEEAIQEYLKEKVDHKRKAEPSPVSTNPAAKLPRRETVVKPDNPSPQSCSDSNKVLTASNHILKNSKGDVTTVAILKKKLKKKKPSKENPLKKPAVTMLSFFKKRPPLDQKGGSSALPHQDKVQSAPVVKDEPLDASSSSDDGIEEEIQRYQQQKDQERLQLTRPQTWKEESDSSSDDGIEEAIRRFQQEKKQEERSHQMKKKSTVKQPQLKNATADVKVGLLNMDRMEVLSGKKATKPTNTGPTKRKKKEKIRMEGKMSMPGFSPDRSTSLGSPSPDSLNGRGHVVPLSRPEPTPVPMLKVNTTAELMCAEAILDISKAVMPMTFDPSPHPLEPTLLVPSTGPPLSSKDPSDAESSVDSEDGIELEIRKFLEQKAQMQKEVPPALVIVHHPPTVTCRPKPATESEKGDQSGDKSSSLDSDEDLDAAIKDLLKTKKRVKRKTKKIPTKPAGTPSTVQPSKKHKVLPSDPVKTAKSSLPKRVKKKISQVKNKKAHKAVKGSQDAKPEKKGKAPGLQAKPQRPDIAEGVGAGLGIPERLTIKEEDSSSVDSDDSIEQEIRKFLAEKAKGGGGGKTSTASNTTTITATVKTEDQEAEGRHQDQQHRTAISPPRAIKLEDQQAEIPPDLGIPCSDAQHGAPQNLESSRDGRATVGTPGRDRLSHTPPVTCRREGKRSFEERHTPVASPPPDEKPHLNPGYDSPSSRTHTLSHTPSRTVTVRCSPNTTQTPSSPGEIPPSQTSPCSAHTSTPTARGFPGLSQSSSASALDSCGRNTVSSTSLPVVTFYRSSQETPVSRDSQSVRVGGRLQSRGMCGRWDQPMAAQTEQPYGGALQRNQENLPGQLTPLASHSQAGGRQEREGREEREREGQADIKEEKLKGEEECIDETDLDSEEERSHRKRQSQGRQQRFPSVSLERSIDPGIVLSPYIVLSTEERTQKARRFKVQNPKKCTFVKKKLQFLVCNTGKRAHESEEKFKPHQLKRKAPRFSHP